MSRPFALLQISGTDEAAITAILALYRRAIPASERKPDAEIRAMAGSLSHRVIVAISEAQVIGFALLYRGSKLAVLEYLAVEDGWRSQGVGSALYLRARAVSHPHCLVIEVESDREPSQDLPLRRRRLAFYRRLGCRSLPPLDYVLPLPADGPPALIDLLVDGVHDETLRPDTLADWLREIYAGVYGCGLDDTRLRAALRSVPREPRLS